MCVGSCLVVAASHHCGCGTSQLGWAYTPLLGERKTGDVIHTGRKKREEGKEGDRDGGREDQSLLTSRTHAFLYLKFDYLWPLDNSDVKDLAKMNQEVCFRNASSVDGWGGRKGEGEDVSTSGCSISVHVVSFVMSTFYSYSWLPWLHKHSEGGT